MDAGFLEHNRDTRIYMRMRNLPSDEGLSVAVECSPGEMVYPIAILIVWLLWVHLTLLSFTRNLEELQGI